MSQHSNLIEQTVKDAVCNVPVVLHRKNNKQWLAIVPLDEFLRLATLLTSRESTDAADRVLSDARNHRTFT